MSAKAVERKAVLITGASSGIGAVTARVLAARGFHVYAGVRTAAAGERIATDAGPRCTPVRIDVTDRASILAAAETLRRAGGIYGLVNNAGIAVWGPLEFLPPDAIRRAFAVNTFGALEVTQAMLPLLRRSLGRVVNVGSIAGRIALPLMGPYAASKAALASLTATLRAELLPFDIGVSYVEPGAHRTPIWGSATHRAGDGDGGLPPLARDLYAMPLALLRAVAERQARASADPVHVARTIGRALESVRPHAVYTVGADARAGAIVAGLPAPVRERLLALAALRSC